MWTVLGRQQEKLRLQGQREEEGKKETMLMQTALRMPISLLCYEKLVFFTFYRPSGRFVTLNYYL